MAAKRAERLVNLVIALRAPQFVTAAKIRATVPGYDADDRSEKADEAFKRMFERDKAELREMGVPLETGRTSAFDTEDGYRIARADYELPEIHLTGEEAAAVGLALRLWESAQLAGAAHSALVKLKAAGVDVDSSRTIPLRRAWTRGSRPSRPATPPPATAGSWSSATSGPTRTSRPPPGPAVGVVAWHGRWYLVGQDLDRGAPASSGCPVSSAPRRRPAPQAPSSRPPVSTSPTSSPGRSGRGARGGGSGPGPAPRSGCAGATPLGPADDGDDRLQLRTTEPGQLADQLAAFGADVLVESPAEVRDAVLARLTRLAAMGVPA